LLLAVAVLAQSAGAAVPNGEASKPIPRVLADIAAAAEHAHSVYVVGGDSSLSLALRLVAGRGGGGMVSEEGLSFRFIEVGAKFYFYGNAAFLKKYAGSGGAELLRGRWLEVPASNVDAAPFRTFTSIPVFFKGLLQSHGTYMLGKSRVIRGQQTIALVDTTGGDTLYIAANGPPVPVEVTPSSGKGSIAFEAWNQPLPVKAPTGAIPLG
jgi:hypothetical protein